MGRYFYALNSPGAIVGARITHDGELSTPDNQPDNEYGVQQNVRWQHGMVIVLDSSHSCGRSKYTWAHPWTVVLVTSGAAQSGMALGWWDPCWRRQDFGWAKFLVSIPPWVFAHRSQQQTLCQRKHVQDSVERHSRRADVAGVPRHCALAHVRFAPHHQHYPRG